MANIISSQEQFDTLINNSQVPVLVDFFATWCGPCKMLAPLVEEVATELEGKVQVVKIDVDQVLSVARQYSISSIPTLVVIKGGKEVNRSVGYISKEEIKALVL